MLAVQPNEFVLAHDPQGRHYEEFVWKAEKDKLLDIMDRAEKGTLGGHVPQPGERYGARCCATSGQPARRAARQTVVSCR